MARIGPLLANALGRIKGAGADARTRETMALAAHIGGSGESDHVPLIVQLTPARPKKGETWPEFKDRVAKKLDPTNQALSGGKGRPVYLANALATSMGIEQAEALKDNDRIEMVELDPLVKPTLMDDSIVDIELDRFYNRVGSLTGEGVKVAVLDSGIDTQHPYLAVAKSVTTCGESVDIPGRHGTHCAGSIASKDGIFRGVAPGVTLLNIKVLTKDGNGHQTNIMRGVEAALDLDADILSMSLGFNHLPAWSDGGHGWACSDGRCPMCTAVDNAVSLGATIIVAAGNEHERANALRNIGSGSTFDTELGCPGQSRGAITVGAMMKRTFQPASFSSRGPTAYGEPKPELVGPGVNVWSTVPVPRLSNGKPDPSAPRGTLFDRESGTSMATPIVAGAAALIFQHRRSKGLSTSPAAIRKALINDAVASVGLPINVVGAGRINIGAYS